MTTTDKKPAQTTKPKTARPKSLGDLAKQEREDPADFTGQNKNKDKQLIFVVSGDQHTQFKKDAADAGLSMREYFLRLWKGKS